MTSLHTLPAFGPDGILHVVVEAPRGATVKPVYDPDMGVFTVARALPLGLGYPFDWGFVPGTRAEDGDPVDALVLHDAASFPGAVLKCHPLGLLKLDQRSGDGDEREANHRLVALPTWHDRLGIVDRVDKLPQRLREEIEQFFLSTTFFTGKDARLRGWDDAEAALAFVRQRIVT